MGMDRMIIEMSIEILLGIIIPLTGTGIFIVRYFWKKEQSFSLMKQKIDGLSRIGVHDTHGIIYGKINEQGNRITALETKMNLLLEHFKIKFEK